MLFCVPPLAVNRAGSVSINNKGVYTPDKSCNHVMQCGMRADVLPNTGCIVSEPCYRNNTALIHSFISSAVEEFCFNSAIRAHSTNLTADNKI